MRTDRPTYVLSTLERKRCGSYDEIGELLALTGPTTLSREVINRVDKDGRSAWHYACLNDDVRLVRVLKKDSRVDLALRTPKGDTCAHLAALYACLEVLKELFDEPRASELWESQNMYGETCLHLCAGSGDKSAAKAARLILTKHPKLLLCVDKWKRGPLDVAFENGENQLVGVFNEFLESDQASETLRADVKKIRDAFLADKNARPAISESAMSAQKNMFAAMKLGGVKLKKTTVTEKTMFKKQEGALKSGGGGMDAKSTGKVLSKMIDFPGDYEEIKKHLADDKVSAGGKDAYGLTALMKFGSWNKVELIDLLLPKLSKQEINEQDPDGKTALHLSCEMASVAAVSRLVGVIDANIKDKQGRTAADIVNSGGSSGIIVRLKKALEGSK